MIELITSLEETTPAVNGVKSLCSNIHWTRALSSRFVRITELENLGDNDLVKLTLSGNPKVYEALVCRYQKLVYNVLYQMRHNHDFACDLTQETFLRAFRALASFQKDRSFKPWLLRIATNIGLNAIRDSRLKIHDSLESLMEDNPQAEPASDENVETEVEWRLSLAMLKDALLGLPVRNRHAFILRYQHDLSYNDIAQIMEEPETTVKTLLFRTREKLRNMLLHRMRP